jgi:hypothetical protein
MPRSNRDRRPEIEWRRRILLWLNSVGETEVDGRHGRQLGWAKARVTGHETWWGLTLRDLEDKGNPFCKLMVKETVEGERATMARFGRCLAMMRAATGGALTLRSSSTASPCSPQAPPWVNWFGRRWIKLVRWLSSCARVWGLREKNWRVWAAFYRASWSYS